MLCRIIINESGAGVFYTIEEITDFRGQASQGGASAPLTSDHGAMAGLGDDDHAQYLLLSGRAPVLGASGAIAGVTGCYLVLFPRVRATLLAWLCRAMLDSASCTMR